MLISTKATDLELTPAITEYINKKLKALERHVSVDDESAHAEVEIGKTTAHHRSGDVFRAEINLHVAGKQFRAEAVEIDLYGALDTVKDEMERELTTHKNKKMSVRKRWGQKIKTALRRG